MCAELLSRRRVLNYICPTNGYSFLMPIRVNRLLAALLVLALGLGPTGGAWAKNHACDTDDGGMSAVTEHAGHTQLQPGQLDDVAVTQPADNCLDCPPDCCSGAACSANACGSGIAALLSHLPALLGPFDSDVSPTRLHMALSERLTSFFKPPRA